MPELTLVYEDSELRVEAFLIPSETVVFSFNNYLEDPQDGVRQGHPFLPDHGLSAIYITARQNHWWQFASNSDFARHILPLSRPYARRITYGGSMGGFGALLFAKHLEATGVVATAPQTIISDPRYKLKRVWAKAIAQVTITRDDISDTIGAVPDIRLLYDPWYPIDRPFADRLAGLPQVQHYLFPFVGHDVLRFLNRLGIVSKVISGILTDRLSPAQVRGIVRPLRRRNAIYMDILKARCALRQARP